MKGYRIALFYLVGALVAGAGSFYFKVPEKIYFTKNELVDRELYSQCKTKILEKLVSPATAIFVEEAIVSSKLSDVKIGLYLYVDSSNAFGAMIRSKFICTGMCLNYSTGVSCPIVDVGRA